MTNLKDSRNYNLSKKILVFNPEKRLIIIGKSTQSIARALNLRPQSISFAATGKMISTGGYYFRYIPEAIEIEISDIGELNLLDFDQLCGIERKVFKTRKMRKTSYPTKKAPSC